MRQGLDINAMLERGNGGRHRARPDLQQIRAAGDEWLVAHPDHMRGELVDAFGRLAGIREQIAARNVDIGFEGKGNRITLARTIGRTIESDDFLEPCGSTRAGQQNVVAGGGGARDDGTREAAEIAVWAIDPLHWETERSFDAVARNLDRVK